MPDTAAEGYIMIDGHIVTLDQTKSALRDKARLDFLQKHLADLREKSLQWEVVSNNLSTATDLHPTARDAIDVAMAIAKEDAETAEKRP